jgi:hypothetical protein
MSLLGLAGAPGRAYVTTPVLVPAHAQPGQTVSVEVSYGFCDALLDYFVTRDGNAIHVEFNSFHATSGDWCIYSPETFAYPIGHFEAGTYTVQVGRHYQGFFGDTVHEPMATFGLRVGAEPIPALGSIGAVVLITVLLALVGRCRQRALPKWWSTTTNFW